MRDHRPGWESGQPAGEFTVLKVYGDMRGTGSPIVTTTDGHSQMLGTFFATFDRPARAVLCACAYPPGGAHEYQAQVCV